MSSFGTVTIKAVRAMLEKCAPGHTFRPWGDHYNIITFGDKEFPQFPTGEKGKFNPEVKRGVVKKMARHLGIYDCARHVLNL